MREGISECPANRCNHIEAAAQRVDERLERGENKATTGLVRVATACDGIGWPQIVSGARRRRVGKLHIHTMVCLSETRFQEIQRHLKVRVICRVEKYNLTGEPVTEGRMQETLLKIRDEPGETRQLKYSHPNLLQLKQRY